MQSVRLSCKCSQFEFNSCCSFFCDFWKYLSICGHPLGVRVRVLVILGLHTALCGAHETSIFKFCIKNCPRWVIWGPTETSGSWSNHLVYSFLCYKKILKFGLFKIPSFKIKNNAPAVYLHQTRAPHTTPIPASLDDHLWSFLTSVLKVKMIFN